MKAALEHNYGLYTACKAHSTALNFSPQLSDCYYLNIVNFNYLNIPSEGEGPPTFLPNVPRFDPLRIGEQCDFIITLGGDGT
eukprot:1247-Heterococcus_DN1.PRE.1